MSILNIVTQPNQILRQVAKSVPESEIKQKGFQKLLSDMAETMIARDGVGLAAPQIDISSRIIVVNTKHGPMALINPVLSKKSLSKEWDEEGCLSIPHTFGKVKRHKSVICDFIDQTGQKRRIEANGFLARIIQHEIDHLDGILFIDKAKDITDNNYSL